jgi:hypothetical protein
MYGGRFSAFETIESREVSSFNQLIYERKSDRDEHVLHQGTLIKGSLTEQAEDGQGSETA